MRRIGLALVAAIALASGFSGLAGKILVERVIHPPRRASDSLVAAMQKIKKIGATPEDFDVQANDGIRLRGWKVQAPSPSGDWVLLYHGITDNRTGMVGQAQFLLRYGYGVVMMDSRAHGESGGDMTTLGWQERYDTVATANALYANTRVRHLYALGVSMGAAIALQSAAVEPRLSAVVAEDPFASLREVSYDYAGLRVSPLLGKTLFRPAPIMALSEMSKQGGLDPDEVSPEKSVSERTFPAFLICGTNDGHIPCRHVEMIAHAAKGPVEVWVVQGGRHASAFRQEPDEYEKRVISFFGKYSKGTQ